MKQQIINVSGHQTSKVIALLYVVLTVPFIFIGVLSFMFGGTPEDANEQKAQMFTTVFLIFAPVIYGVTGYIFMRIGCWIYNLIARYAGGIEFTLAEK